VEKLIAGCRRNTGLLDNFEDLESESEGDESGLELLSEERAQLPQDTITESEFESSHKKASTVQIRKTRRDN